jgi:hypothetical protein
MVHEIVVFRVVWDTEKQYLPSFLSLTSILDRVVLPAPDGEEIITN